MISLEERVVRELQAEVDHLPDVTRGPVPHRRSFPWGRLMATAAVIAALIGGGWLVVNRRDAPPPVVAGPSEVVLAGTLEIPVTGEKLRVGDVTVDKAAPGPALNPGVDPPGIEVPLDQQGPVNERLLPNDTDGPLVYLGEANGESFLLHDDNPPVAGFFEEVVTLYETLIRGQGPTFCDSTPTSTGCHEVRGEPQFSSAASKSGDEPWVRTTMVFELPRETAAVVVTTPEGTFWQRPVGRSVAITWESDEAESDLDEITMEGLNSSGDELFSQSTRQPFLGDPTTSYPRESQ